MEKIDLPFARSDLAVCSLLYDLISLSVQESLLIIIAIRAPSVELRVRDVLVKGKCGEGHRGTRHARNTVQVSCSCITIRGIF
jgi:hypothetical protein